MILTKLPTIKECLFPILGTCSAMIFLIALNNYLTRGKK